MAEATAAAETRRVEEEIPAEETAPTLTEESALIENDDAAPDVEEEQEEDINSKKVTLADLSAKGTALYAHKKYEEASDIFSRASILQAEINGETAPENSEILFHYGRSLFKVGQSKSDVLGGSAAAEAKTKSTGNRVPKKPVGKPAETEAEKVTQEGIAIVAEKTEAKTDDKDDVPEMKKPLFQFTGDENFDESDEDEEQGDDEQEEEEEDDLATAFEILDLARVCYIKQLEKIQDEDVQDETKGKEPAKEDSSAVRHIKERLAETHDALSEISLENERYPNAIEDGRVSLNYKIELYPEESEIIAEAHYKLSLALEFASVTVSEEDGKNTKREEMDQGLRDEAIKEMELAIRSFKLKMQATEVDVASSASPEDNDLSRKALAEMKEVLADMEQRLVDLKKDPISAQDLLAGDGVNPLGGIFGAALGETAADVETRIKEATEAAVDLTNLVRKKNAKDSDANGDNAVQAHVPPAANGNGKRKAEDDPEDSSDSAKKAKVDEELATVEA